MAIEFDSETYQRQAVAPNIFYDLIVFMTPTITLFAGVALGMRSSTLVHFPDFGNEVDFPKLIIMIVLLFLGSYEFGRIAETYSDTFIAKPIRWLHKHKIVFASPDYGLSLSPQVEMIGIPAESYFGRVGSKWTLYFLALEYVPHVGADLLKRYAWEKLARSSAFSMLLISTISLVFLVYYKIHKLAAPSWEFGSAGFTITSFVLCLLWSVDYYKRNCWNNDLLVTTTPVILSALKKPRSEAEPTTT